MIKRILGSKLFQFVILMTLVVFLAFSNYLDFRYRETIRFFAFDTLNRIEPRERTNNIIIVDIDEKTLEKLGQWPFPRNILAELVTNMKDAGVEATVFDMVFAEADRSSPHLLAEQMGRQPEDLQNYDDIFAKSLAEAGNVVTGFMAAGADETRRLPQASQPVMIKRGDKAVLSSTLYPLQGVATNIPVISNAAAGNGIFLAVPDKDGIIRSTPIIVQFNNNFYPSLSIEALRVANDPRERLKIGDPAKNPFKDKQLFGNIAQKDYLLKIGEGGLSLPLNRNGYFQIKFRDMDKDKDYISAYKILDPAYKNEVSERLNGKIAFIGTSAAALKDIRSSPLQPFIPGVEVHANIVEQIIQQDFLYYDEWLVDNIELLAIIGLGLLFVALSFFIGVLFLTYLLGIIAAITFGASYYGYTGYGFLFDPIYPSFCLTIIFIVTVIWNYIRTESRAKEIRSAFGLYISPQFMEELTENPDKLKLGGEMRELTVMFTDIRNFTTISENMTPQELIHTMNDFLTPMSDVVMEKRGTIDKYMGDAMMAFWNAPLDDNNHVAHAVEAALKMRNVLEPINKNLQDKADKEGREALKLAAGIGINTGQCAVGNMGSKQRFAYSALGDAVNIASRLEGQTKTYGLDLLIGEDSAVQIKDFALIEIDKIRVKGRVAPVRIYTALGLPKMAKKKSFRQFRARHKQFLNAYRRMQWDKAEEVLQGLLQNDKYAISLKAYYDVMQSRIKAYQNETPPHNWDGVYIAESK